ncbi:MAG: transposase [Candidatus Saccharibacteria bacterium]|nr:transposase [Pseudorhodobacter sp.]
MARSDRNNRPDHPGIRKQWAKIEPHCLGKKSDLGGTGGDARLFLEGVFGIARTVAQWRDLPGQFGKWNSVYCGFGTWAFQGELSAFIKL